MIADTGVETVILVATLGASLLGMAAAAVMAVRARTVAVKADVGVAVREAPYHRLHNVLIVRDKA